MPSSSDIHLLSRPSEQTMKSYGSSHMWSHTKTNPITWLEFCSAFRSHHVPTGLMKLKKKEFLALKQGSMSIAEYRDKFIQLSWFTPTEVDDEKRQELFMEGLNDGL